MATIELIDVEPIGEREVFCFENNGPDWRTHTHGWRTLPEYPEPRAEAVRMRELRVECRVGLGALARELGMRPSDIGSLERGRKVPASSDDWRLIHETIQRMAEG